MSNKLKEVMSASRKIYETEKEKFLDALAKFIEPKVNCITEGDHYSFIIYFNSLYDSSKNNIKVQKCRFFVPNSIDFSDYTTEIIVYLPKETIFKFLESEYHAEVKHHLAYRDTYEVNFYFV